MKGSITTKGNELIVLGNTPKEIADLLKKIQKVIKVVKISAIIPNGVTEIGDCAFEGCAGLTSITIPDTVTAIGDRAFFGCSGLTSVTLPDSVNDIGISAFYKCSGLTSITIGNSVTSIGNYAFSGCSGLTSITIPNGVTSIGAGAFDGCSGLTSITIPNSVARIEEYAFSDSGLTSHLGNYKAFILTPDGKLKCRDKIYTVGKRSFAKGPLAICENGLHYCANLFDIFNYYYGEYGKDFVIAECKVSKENTGKEDNDSKRCARSIIPERILSREEVINILNA